MNIFVIYYYKSQRQHTNWKKDKNIFEKVLTLKIEDVMI